MKPKPPYQLLILDDHGQQLFTCYVSVGENGAHPQAFDLSHHLDLTGCVQQIKDAIKLGQVDDDANWVCL